MPTAAPEMYLLVTYFYWCVFVFLVGAQNYARADDKIALHNHEDAGYTLAHNAFSHM